MNSMFFVGFFLFFKITNKSIIQERKSKDTYLVFLALLSFYYKIKDSICILLKDLLIHSEFLHF